MNHTYNFPNVGTLADIAVTDSRETAIRHITKGYAPFTVPQMFGKEEGQFTLVLADRNPEANQKSEDDAHQVLSDFEAASRAMCNSR